MRKIRYRSIPVSAILAAIAILTILLGILWEGIPPALLRAAFLLFGGFLLLLAGLGERQKRQWQRDFANQICMTADALMDGRETEIDGLYEESQVGKVKGKLLQCYDRMGEGQRQSRQDMQTIQELVSDISHQVKTPVANIKMFTNILQNHQLSDAKREEFLTTISQQTEKLDFLMQSLVKMSRLETGIFTLQIKNNSLYNTIAQAVNGIWAKADQKGIQIRAECDSHMMVSHDAKWTAEALGNILDNAVKYTKAGGNISINVRPWQFYTRIDIKDTGIGIAPEHYNDVFLRFYRGQEGADAEGIGLGLYLARSIITRQKGYISVESELGKGTVFSVFLLN